MPHDPLAKHYHRLPPRERFALITKAADRGDDVQREQLLQSAPRISRLMPGHFPHVVAFDELGMLIFLELLEDAARIDELLQLVDEYEQDEDCGAGARRPPGDPDNTPLMRTIRLVSGSSYMLRTKVQGWRLFCEQIGVPEYHLWQNLAGLERLQRMIRFTEQSAFTVEGMKVWLDRIRPAGKPPAEVRTAQDYASELRTLYERQTAYWNGRSTSS